MEATIPFHRVRLTEHEIEAVADALRSGWLTSGPAVRAFEAEFAAFVGAPEAIAVSNGTMAALVTLDALGIGPGSFVAVPVWTFSGPAMMARRLGAVVVPCDVDPVTLNLTVETVSAACPWWPDVIMPTHFAGLPVELTPFFDAFPDALIVDDAAHALPATYANGEPVGGSLEAKASFFSFYATKTLTTGEGGMITTHDPELAARIRKFRQHGFDRPMDARYTEASTGWAYDIAAEGWKANMTDPTAALGRVQLTRVHEMQIERAAIVDRYMAELDPRIGRPAMGESHAWHLFVARVPDRDGFIERMALRGVRCSVHFIPLHHHSSWQAYWRSLTLLMPNADAAFAEAVSLPLFPDMTTAEIDRVIAAANDSLKW